MPFCPLNNAHLPCDKNCAWWIQTGNMCAMAVIARSMKDLRDICVAQDEECREEEKRSREIKYRSILENRPIFEIEKEILREKEAIEKEFFEKGALK